MKEYQLTARAQALRNRMVEQPAVCTERAVYLTESWQNTAGIKPTIRRAPGPAPPGAGPPERIGAYDDPH